jgi:hypothetical protein
MARARIFSSRRMFSSRSSAFGAASKQSGPLGRVIGMTAAAIIIFAVGVYTGRTFPQLFTLSSSAPVTPVTAAEF